MEPNKYALEGLAEQERLEFQATIPGYGAHEGMESRWLESARTVLDVGCGSGVLTRWLRRHASDSAWVAGCDASRTRAPGAAGQEAQGSALPAALSAEIHWMHGEAIALPVRESSMDLVTARFLFEYLPNPAACCEELNRVLRPAGRAVLIDLDGVLHGIEAPRHDLATDLATLRTRLDVDCFAGRKLLGYLSRASFAEVAETRQSLSFTGDGLAQEKVNYESRFRLALPALAKALGSRERAAAFVGRYLRALDDPETVLLYHLVTATGLRSREDHRPKPSGEGPKGR